MTATQIFILFLKQELSPSEYIFFMHYLSKKRRGGKAKPVLRKGFVEEYLSRTRRTFGGFMTRLFVLCPSLLRCGLDNPTYMQIYKDIRPIYYGKFCSPSDDDYFFWRRVNSKCVSVYRYKWHAFLEKHIISEKKFNSVYKEGETYSYEYIE